MATTQSDTWGYRLFLFTFSVIILVLSIINAINYNKIYKKWVDFPDVTQSVGKTWAIAMFWLNIILAVITLVIASVNIYRIIMGPKKDEKMWIRKKLELPAEGLIKKKNDDTTKSEIMSEIKSMDASTGSSGVWNWISKKWSSLSEDKKRELAPIIKDINSGKITEKTALTAVANIDPSIYSDFATHPIFSNDSVKSTTQPPMPVFPMPSSSAPMMESL